MIVWESLMCTDELWDLEHAVGFAENRGLMAHPGFVSLCVEYSVFKVMSSFKVMSLLTLYRAQGAAGEENSSSCWKSKREWLCVVALLWAECGLLKLVSSQQGFCTLQRW